MSRKIFPILPQIIASLFLVGFIAYAWTEPTQAPPGGNVDTPINTGLIGQIKQGNLQVNALGIQSTGNALLVPNGNVGIGTPSPGYKLDVNGDVRWTGTLQGGSVPWLRLTSFPTACSLGQYVTAVGSSLTCSTPAGGGGVGDITGVIAGTGLTGGGLSGDVTLSANTAYLQRIVNGTCAVGSSIRLIASDGTVTCETDDVGIASESDTLQTVTSRGISATGGIILNTGGAVNGLIVQYGNVGIGTVSPVYKLDILQGAMRMTELDGGTTAVLLNPTNYGGIIDLYYAGSLNTRIAGDSNQNSYFHGNGNGNVGIGTTAPGYKLDAQGGQINASGGLCIAGDCKTSWSAVSAGSDIEFPDGIANVTPVTADLASVYTVPAGKTLYITNYYQGSASPGNLYINGVSLWAGFSGINAYTLRMPIIVGAGGTVSAGTGPSSFNGYLK